MTTLRKKYTPDLEELEQTEQAYLENLRKLPPDSPLREQINREYQTVKTAAREATKLSSSAQICSALDELKKNKENSIENLRAVRAKKGTPEQVNAAVDDFLSASALVKEAKRRQSTLVTPAQTSEIMQVDKKLNTFRK